MSRDKILKEQRNKSILEEYTQLESLTEKGIQKYRYEEILKILSAKYYLAPNTISLIISK